MIDLMRYLTTFGGGQIGKGYEKGVAAIEFILQWVNDSKQTTHIFSERKKKHIFWMICADVS